MRRPVDTHALTEVSDALAAISQGLAAAEDDLLSCLVVMGEPDPQHRVDDWVDQVVDLLRAVDEVAGLHRATIARSMARHPDPPAVPSGTGRPVASLAHSASSDDPSAAAPR